MEDNEINFSALLNGSEGEEIKEKYPIIDIDKFYTELYNYYIERGYYTIMAKLIGKNLFQAITILFYFIVNLCINWNVVFFNTSSNKLFEYSNTNSVWYYFIYLSIIILTLQLIASIIYSVKYINYMKKIRYFYNKIFCIEDSSLTFLKWSDITKQLVDMKNNNKFPYIRKKIDELSIVKRITRKKNYIILLVKSSYLENYYISTELLEYLNYIFMAFTESYKLDHNYLESKKLYYWLKTISIINFILIPFKLLYIIILFVLTNAESLYTKRDVIGNRHWTNKEFYLYNEYDHLFKNRMNKAGFYMNLWITKHSTPIINAILTFIISISSCIVSLFTPIIIINSTLSEYQIHGNTIIWYLACFSSIIILCRKYLLHEQTKSLSHNKLREKILFYTQKDENNKNDSYKNENNNIILLKLTYKEFLELYVYTIVIFFKNIYSIFTLPFIFNKLANSYLPISNYMIRSTYTDPLDGDICMFSNFENIEKLRSLGSSNDSDEEKNKEEKIMEKSIRIYITRNKDWYNNYKDGLNTKYSCKMLYDINKKGNIITTELKKIENKIRNIEINYNEEEDNDLLNSNLFSLSQNNIEDTSTILQENEKLIL